MSKRVKFIIYALIYVVFMIVIRIVLSTAHGFLIEHCLMIFLTVSVIMGYIHGYNFKFNFNILFVAIFMMLFIGQLTPMSKGFKVYDIMDFVYVSASTIFMIAADIAGHIKRMHEIQKECFEEQLEMERKSRLIKEKNRQN